MDNRAGLVCAGLCALCALCALHIGLKKTLVYTVHLKPTNNSHKSKRLCPVTIMGNVTSTLGFFTSPPPPPEPVSVHITHTLPRQKDIPGYVSSNDFTLEYTLVQGRSTVGDLLSMMSQYDEPKRYGVMGVRRLQPSERHDSEQPHPKSDALPLDTILREGDRLGLVVV